MDATRREAMREEFWTGYVSELIERAHKVGGDVAVDRLESNLQAAAEVGGRAAEIVVADAESEDLNLAPFEECWTIGLYLNREPVRS